MKKASIPHKDLELLRGVTPFFTSPNNVLFLCYAKLAPPLHNTVLLMLFLSVSFIPIPQNGWKRHYFVVMDTKIHVPHHLWRLACRECLILSFHAIPPSFCGLPHPPPAVEVLPRSYKLLFIPWCGWRLAALKGLSAFSFLPPSLFVPKRKYKK